MEEYSRSHYLNKLVEGRRSDQVKVITGILMLNVYDFLLDPNAMEK